MGGSRRTDKLQLSPKKELGGYEDAFQCLILFLERIRGASCH